MNGDAQANQRIDQSVMLGTCDVDIAWVQEPKRRLVVRPRERPLGRTHEHLPEVGRHALRPEGATRQCHRGRIARGYGFPRFVARRRLTAMASYVVSARIEPSRPHRAAAPAAALDADTPPAVEPWLLDTTPADQRALELRWEAVRERWSQLTFYLFDVESWR